MAESIVLVESLSDWPVTFPDVRVVKATDYLDGGRYARRKAYHVINLCRGYKYQSVGYYCSLLAEARGHRVIPSVKTLQDLSRKSLYGYDFDEFDAALSKKLARVAKDLGSCTLKLECYFGVTQMPALQELSRRLFEQFPCPMLELEFRLGDRATLQGIRALTLRNLNEQTRSDFAQALQRFQSRRWRDARGRKRYQYDLAILTNPAEVQPPSDDSAIRKFVRAGEALGINVEVIHPKDYGRLAEYDALFIRETTALNHHSYLFSRRADKEGLVVIDDPTSILRCTNKVYLAELLATHRLPTPKTRVFRREEFSQAAELGFPLVIKIPEGSFSRGVFKADNAQQLEALAPTVFKDTELVLAQEFVFTEFDWRVGILNRQPLYVCQYKMARKHWQIIKHAPGGKFTAGGYTTMAVADVPAEVVATALKAADLIGDGLYGVDLKQTDRGVVVIEVNDNPSIEAGVEDAVIKGKLYRSIMQDFLRRLDAMREGAQPRNGTQPSRG